MTIYRWSIPASNKVSFLFTKSLTQTDSGSLSNSVRGMCGMCLCTSNMTPPPFKVLSFLYMLYGKESGNNSDVNICLLNRYNLRLMKVNEGQQLKLFTSYTVYVDTGKFQTTNKTVFASQGFSGLGFMTFCK